MDLHGSAPTREQRSNQISSTRTVPLLEPAQLLQAVSGRCTSTGPLVHWARELSDLHAELIPFQRGQASQQRDFVDEHIRARIDRVVGDIDAWAAHHIPRAKGARKHTHSLGQVISHIAETYAEVWWTVLHSSDVETRHQAWFHLGEARDGYAEMVDQIRERHLQLPLGWAGIRRGIQ